MERKTERKRAKKMLPEITNMITERAINEPQQHREKLAEELIAEIEKLFPSETPPVFETVVRKISEARNKWRKEDEPWHLGILDDYPISSKAIGQIFELKTQGLQRFSIRDAKWFDRLSSTDLPLQVLRRVAQLMSMKERVSDISRTDFDTSPWERTIVGLLEDPQYREMMVSMAERDTAGLDAVARSDVFIRHLKDSKKSEKEAQNGK